MEGIARIRVHSIQLSGNDRFSFRNHKLYIVPTVRSFIDIGDINGKFLDEDVAGTVLYLNGDVIARYRFEVDGRTILDDKRVSDDFKDTAGITHKRIFKGFIIIRIVSVQYRNDSAPLRVFRHSGFRKRDIDRRCIQ